MPEDAAVLDPPTADATVDDTVETDPAGGGDPGASPESGEGTSGEGTPAGESSGSGESGLVVDGKRLSEAAKATLAEIKAKDPKLAAEIKNALFAADALRRAAPGGAKEIAALRQRIEDLGGEQGIAAICAEQQEWQALDRQFETGDPGFIQNIAESSPEAFLKLAPVAFQKFQELNPEGYSAYVSQVFVADMQQEGIPLMLERLQDFIGDNPKAIAIWKQLAGYVNRLSGFASKPVNAPATKRNDGAIDERERGVTQREENLVRTEWRGSADSARMNVFNAEYARLSAGRKVTDAQAAAIKELYVSRLQAALRKTQDFNQTIDRYFSNRDREGYVRYISSIYKQEIPRALRSAFDSVVPGRPGPKPNAGTPAAGRANAAAAAAGNPANGFQWLAAAPPKDKIDVTRTSTDMIRQGKAVLTDGKRVQWKR